MSRLVSKLVEDQSVYYWKFYPELILGATNKPDDIDVRKAKREGALSTEEERTNSLYWDKVYGQKIILIYENDKKGR